MKIRNIIILTALFLAVLFLGACGSWDGSDGQGSIIINLGNAARAGTDTAGYTVDTTGMTYTITLNGSGKIIKKTTGDTSISIPVSEGIWNIKIEAKGDRVIGRQQEEKGVVVTVSNGKPASADINMTVTGTRVSTWAELKEDFDELNKSNGKLNDLEEIEITPQDEKTFEVNTTAIENAPTLKVNKTITLWSEKNVTIKRSNGIDTKATVFTVDKGTLILEARNGGTITIDGNKSGVRNCTRALINVNDGGTLKMYNNVTLTNNSTENGGAVHVSGANSYFYMYGGIISGNYADSGGGVYITKEGHLEKKGGIIYGNDVEEALKNTSSKGGGAAVYVSSTSNSDSTLGETDDWPRPKS